jgi:hypothetical protein
MRKIILSFVAAVVAVGGIWLVSSNPHARESLKAEAATLKIDIQELTRKAKNLPVTVVDNYL